MSGFTLPPLVVDHDERWLEVPLRGDVRQWAQSTAREVTGRAGLKGRQERALAGVLEGAGEVAQRATDASMGFLLFPDIREPIRAFVRFCPVDLAGAGDDEAWPAIRDELLADELPEDPAEITEVATRAGPCHRIRRRQVTGEGSARAIGEQLAYVWTFPQYDAGVVMTTAFTDIKNAVRWLAALDELAVAVDLEEVGRHEVGHHEVDFQEKVPTPPGPPVQTDVVELRPVPPPGRLVPADKAALRKWLLRADRADGTLVFAEDRAGIITSPRTVTLALPSTGRPDAVRAISLADYRWVRNLQTGITFRLLLLDGDGRVLHTSRARDQPKASQMWPRDLFTPLESLGIPVTEEHFPSTEAFRAAHPDVKIFA